VWTEPVALAGHAEPKLGWPADIPFVENCAFRQAALSVRNAPDNAAC
jgi:hypothetical protein